MRIIGFVLVALGVSMVLCGGSEVSITETQFMALGVISSIFGSSLFMLGALLGHARLDETDAYSGTIVGEVSSIFSGIETLIGIGKKS